MNRQPLPGLLLALVLAVSLLVSSLPGAWAKDPPKTDAEVASYLQVTHQALQSWLNALKDLQTKPDCAKIAQIANQAARIQADLVKSDNSGARAGQLLRGFQRARSEALTLRLGALELFAAKCRDYSPDGTDPLLAVPAAVTSDDLLSPASDISVLSQRLVRVATALIADKNCEPMRALLATTRQLRAMAAKLAGLPAATEEITKFNLTTAIRHLDDINGRLEAAIKQHCKTPADPVETQPKPGASDPLCPFDQPTRIQLLSPAAAQIETFDKRLVEMADKVAKCGTEKSCVVTRALEQQKLFAELPALVDHLLNTYDAICAIPDDLKVFTEKVRQVVSNRSTKR